MDIEKEDGENDVALCQLKSTDAMSIKINQKDLRILEEHSAISHKIPVFAIQFLDTGEVWCMIKPDNLKEYMESIRKRTEEKSYGFSKKSVDTKTEKSYNNNRNTEETKKAKLAREQYYKMREAEKEEKEKKYKKGLREWKRTLNKKE